MSKWLLGGVAVLLLFIGVVWWSTENDLVTKDQRVEQAIADVQVDMQRQANLLPQLAEIAERGTEVEIGGFVAIVRERSRILTVDPGEIARNPELQQELFDSQSAIAGALSGIRINFEQYPELRSIDLYQTLADETSEAQNRITRSRQTWNRVTAEYNALVRGLPGRFLAGERFPVRDYYEATADGQVEMPELGLEQE